MRLRPAPDPCPVMLEEWRPNPWALVAVGASVLGLIVGLAAVFLLDRGPLARYEYHLWRWEADTLPANAFARLGIAGAPGDGDGVEALHRYFDLTSRLRAAQESAAPDAALIAALAGERATYENDVERQIEAWIDEAVRGQRLQERLPLFRTTRITWPPVDVELTSPPRLLVTSPRDRIHRNDGPLLEGGLGLREVEEIERRTDDADTVSIVVAIGGLAAYPAIVRDDRSYDGVLETSAHEWVHHYLAFYPLGRRWGSGGDAEPLNETTASIAGREIANLVRAAHPVNLAEGADGRAPGGPAPSVDFGQEMRKLRLEVDALLAARDVAGAERTMEERRLFLAEHGIPIRRLNQAYFAFYGTYADNPASSNPIGPKMERLWELSGSVGVFLRIMREVEDAEELDTALAALERSAVVR